MTEILNKKTLKRLYEKEKRSLRNIAKILGCSNSSVRYRSIKYGIKLRSNKKIDLNKSVLQRLYVKEGKSSKEVAEVLSCSYGTVLNRCKEYGIPAKSKRIKGLSKALLHKLYVKEGKTTREIAKILGCSFEPVRKRCKQLGIPLRNPGGKILDINELALGRLYIKEDKSIPEIAKILDCSVGPIYKRVKQFGLKKQSGKNPS
jgi:DNA-binding CsgD family transcriptional regulator